jgi:hypothetical protein
LELGYAAVVMAEAAWEGEEWKGWYLLWTDQECGGGDVFLGYWKG